MAAAANLISVSQIGRILAVMASTNLIISATGSSPHAIDTWRHVCLRNDTCLHVSLLVATRNWLARWRPTGLSVS